MKVCSGGSDLISDSKMKQLWLEPKKRKVISCRRWSRGINKEGRTTFYAHSDRELLKGLRGLGVLCVLHLKRFTCFYMYAASSVYTYHVSSGAHGGQEMALVPQELDFIKDCELPTSPLGIEPRFSIVAASAFALSSAPNFIFKCIRAARLETAR